MKGWRGGGGGGGGGVRYSGGGMNLPNFLFPPQPLFFRTAKGVAEKEVGWVGGLRQSKTEPACWIAITRRVYA